MTLTDAVPQLQAALGTRATLKTAAKSIAGDHRFSAGALIQAFYLCRNAADRPHENRLLTSDQDSALVGVVHAFFANNFSLSASQIADVVRRRWGMAPGKQWVGRWVARHESKLGWRACKALSDNQAEAQVVEDVKGFCEQLKLFLEQHSFTADAVLNYDETRLLMRDARMTTQRVEMRDKDHPNIKFTRDTTVASLLTFVAARGSVFLSVYVLKGAFGEGMTADVLFSLEEAPKARRRAWPRFFCRTDTGYLNAATFRCVIDELAREWGVRNPGREVLLFGDQLGCHKDVEPLSSPLSKGVYLFFLAPNSFLFNQPPDEVPFAALKKFAVGGGASSLSSTPCWRVPPRWTRCWPRSTPQSAWRSPQRTSATLSAVAPSGRSTPWPCSGAAARRSGWRLPRPRCTRRPLRRPWQSLRHLI